MQKDLWHFFISSEITLGVMEREIPTEISQEVRNDMEGGVVFAILLTDDISCSIKAAWQKKYHGVGFL